MGDGVVNPQGESAGNLKGIMREAANGKIAYAALSFAAILGLGAIVFAALQACGCPALSEVSIQCASAGLCRFNVVCPVS